MSVAPQGFPADVGSALGACIARHGRGAPGFTPEAPPLAVFDWDNTCIANDIGDASYDRMAARAAIALRDDELAALVPEVLGDRPRRAPIGALLAAARGGDRDAAVELRAELLALYDDMSDGTPEGETRRYRWVAEMMAGRTALALEALADAVIDEGLRAPLSLERVTTRDGARSLAAARGLRILAPMASLVRELQGAGWDVRIVSASCAPLVRAFARRIGLEGDRVIGVRLAEDVPGGRLLPLVVDPFPYREGKLAAIDHHIGRRPHLVAGDSPGDLAMLRASLDVRLVVARTPDASAAQVAREEGAERGWLVVSQAELLAAS